jgi:hypothetical protein
MALASAAGSAAQGISSIISGVVGSRKRKQAEDDARDKLDKRIAQYEAFEFKNLYENVENPAEDLRVGLQAAEFQAQQQQQGLAQTLDALRAGGGGVGAAALAQSLAQAQARSQQQIAGNIEQQELANERMAAQMEAQRQRDIAGGGMAVQEMELGRVETLTDMASQDLQRATQARQQARQAVFSGIGQLGGAAASFGAMGGFKEGGLDWARMGGSRSIISTAMSPEFTPANQIMMPVGNLVGNDITAALKNRAKG